MEIKYRRRDLLAAMMRIDPVLRSLEAQRATGEGLDAAIRARQQLLMPMYHSMALQFAEMHETPVRLPCRWCCLVLHELILVSVLQNLTDDPSLHA